MKLDKLLTDIQTKVEDQNKSRRDVIADIGKMSLSAALAAIPFGAAALSTRKVQAQPTGALDILNFALTLEFLEAEFYAEGINSGMFSGADQTVIAQISKHETAHVALLQNAITTNNGTPVTKPTFDFSAGGTFSDWNTNPQTFMALAQAFEDTGVRAYKGQAAGLAQTETLTTALQIHSVEARHASQIRRMRGDKGWITNADNSSLPSATDAVYAGEDNLTQGGINVSTLLTDISNDQVTEAFDEPLTMAEVNAIAGLFIA